jgi:hypothetical protein
VWLVAVLAWFAFVTVLGYRQVLKTTRADARLQLEPWRGEIQRAPALARAVEELGSVGFELIDEFAVTNASSSTNQTSIVRNVVLRDRAAQTWAIAYELTTLLPTDGKAAAIGQQATTVDLVSLLASGRQVTTSNAAYGYFDQNPKHTSKRLPLVRSATELAGVHARRLAKEVQGSPASDLRATDFRTYFADAWTDNFLFQTTRGLFRREGDFFWATPKLARRGIINHWLPLNDPQGWRWLLHLAWTGLLVSIVGAYLARESLDGLAFQVMLGALAGGLGAVVFHPRSFVFATLLAVFGAAHTGFDGAGYALPALLAHAFAASVLTQRDAARAEASLGRAGVAVAHAPSREGE